MTYLILLIPFLLLWAIVSAIVLAWKKLGTWRFLLLLTWLLLVLTTTWKHYEQKFALQAVPDALHVRSILYANEESWGFGPGGNEAGIRFYPLSDEVSARIGRGGINYLRQLPPNKDQASRDWRGRYEQWSETPVQGDHWKINESTGLLNVTDYICAYGFCIDIPPDRLRQANEIVSRPGSFYARGRIGTIVVSPKEKLVLYFYNG
ncbi:MAG: hypothetical protein V4627_10480 [Pseudomonadota bacterium]